MSTATAPILRLTRATPLGWREPAFGWTLISIYPASVPATCFINLHQDSRQGREPNVRVPNFIRNPWGSGRPTATSGEETSEETLSRRLVYLLFCVRMALWNFTIDDSSPYLTYGPYCECHSSLSLSPCQWPSYLRSSCLADGFSPEVGWQTWYSGSGYDAATDSRGVGDSYHVTSLGGAYMSLQFYGGIITFCIFLSVLTKMTWLRHSYSLERRHEQLVRCYH